MLRTRIKLSVRSGSNWNLEALVFGERGKPEHPEKNLSARQRNNNKPTLPYTHKGHYREYLLDPPPTPPPPPTPTKAILGGPPPPPPPPPPGRNQVPLLLLHSCSVFIRSRFTCCICSPCCMYTKIK